MSTNKNQFHCYDAIVQLRRTEKILLHNAIPEVSDTELELIRTFLAIEYKSESIGYPYQPPAFEERAAGWAALTLYRIAQLLLYRQTSEAAVAQLLPPFTGPVTASTILSADLSLRFLPPLLEQAATIDPEDKLVQHTTTLLSTWHYSGIAATLPLEELKWAPIAADDCLQQLYVDRVIQLKNIRLAKHPMLSTFVKSAMGDHATTLWPEL